MSQLRIKFFSLIFLGCSQLISAQDISWSEVHSIEWNDFQCEVPKGASFDAYTHCKLKYEFKQVEGRQLVLISKASFMPERSWSKKDGRTPYILSHEQRHFDIYEAYRRILLMRVEEEQALTHFNFAERIKVIFQKTFSELLEFQDRYDEETAHSQNVDQQKAWDARILDLLQAHKEFIGSEVRFEMPTK